VGKICRKVDAEYTKSPTDVNLLSFKLLEFFRVNGFSFLVSLFVNSRSAVMLENAQGVHTSSNL